jgi:ubiquinone/menaquinone biosynthesis C-methylase UbiE
MVTAMTTLLVARSYDRITRAYHEQRQQSQGEQSLLRTFAIQPSGSRVLDAGCGSGVPVASMLDTLGIEVIWIDISAAMLGLARSNVPRARLLRMSMTTLDFAADFFDGVWSSYSLFHVPRVEHERIVAELHRVLRPRAPIVISVGASEWEGTEALPLARRCSGVNTHPRNQFACCVGQGWRSHPLTSCRTRPKSITSGSRR